MNKKFLFGAALVGILGFGSCVDNNESPSVTNIREAKAEQLKALAAVENANAQAALITANAEAKAKEAQAALAQAQAAVEQAQADLLAAQTEVEKARAEEAIANAEVEKQRAANELQKLAGELEIALLQQKTDLLNAQKDYETALKNSEEDKAAELQELLQAYSSASQQLISAKSTLAQYNIDLARLETNTIGQNDMHEQWIANNNEHIAHYQKYINEAQAKIDAYNTITSIPEAKKELDAIRAQLPTLEASSKDAEIKHNAAYSAASSALNTLQNSEYVQKVDNARWNWEQINNFYPMYWIDGDGNICVGADTENGFVTYPIFTNNNSEIQYEEYAYVEGQGLQKYPYETYKTYFSPVKDGYANYEKAVKASIEANQGATLTAATQAYNTAATAQKAADDAVKAAGENATQAQKDALTQANENLKNASDAKDEAQTALDEVNAKLAENKAKYDAAIALSESNEANIKAYNEASVAEAKAYVVYAKANNAYTAAQSKESALANIADENNWNTIPNQIKSLEESIKNYNTSIKNAENSIKRYEAEIANNNAESDKVIEECKANIAQTEEEIKVLEKKVEIAKGKLDAAMEEETPAE